MRRHVAGFPSERANGIVLFTGERFTSASARHILGEEASRALWQLGVRDRIVASERAARALACTPCDGSNLRRAYSIDCPFGW